MIMDRGDHPRSRGEYARPRRTPIGSLGSSPLSRGIHSVSSGLLPVLGIIPALAGNTLTRAFSSASSRDHPRSRGEYFWAARPVYASRGSSPLSRGIQGRRVCRAPSPGIIPALAGNTRTSNTLPPAHRDHPRSRGEYFSSSCTVWCTNGSSPLSRGILHQCRRARTQQRIIPALAGNTKIACCQFNTTQDHPRSRGEYEVMETPGTDPAGSSPLSRGIHELGENQFSSPRIIPALAGNTPTPDPESSGPWDHPRSRGEYSRVH